MLFAGCATINYSKPVCAVVGALIGGLAVGVIADETKAGWVGAVAGAVIGDLVCGKPADSDGDGVIDSNDQCPGTSAGTAVDATGCPLDSDGDGVADNRDQCPDTPRSTRVDSNGCALDSDGDGVVDSLDRCPDTPRGVAVDARGCPRDSDGDGVTDNRDQCPDTPRGEQVNDVGCHIVFRLEGVNFATDSAQLTADAVSRLEEAVQLLSENPTMTVRLEGHTDSRGAAAYNQQLSQRRAESVVDHLVRRGIARNRMQPVGKGESSPLVSDDTAQGEARNRRVEFVLTGQ
ncbi:MAG: OmpA family protein [Gammaproteobacteria bacterium]|nr:OmpA family protein [Gammaproteobacteria bacterium]